MNISRPLLLRSAGIAALATPVFVVGSVAGFSPIRSSLLTLIIIIGFSLYFFFVLRMLFVKWLNIPRLALPMACILAGLLLWLGSSLITGPLFGVAATPGEGSRDIISAIQVIFLIASSIGELVTAAGLILLSIRITTVVGALRLPLRITWFLSGLMLGGMSLNALDGIARIFHHLSVVAFLFFMLVYTVSAALMTVLFVRMANRLASSSS